MGTGLRDHPKVVRMAGMLKSDCLRVVGALHAVWSIFDEHSPDGLLEFYTLRVMDEKIGWRGFSAAMQAVGWLEESESGLHAPDYEDHNGTSAKRRALDAKRKKEGRDADGEYGGSWIPGGQEDEETRTGRGQMSASDADKTQTRVREDKKKKYPPTPQGEGRFAEFWTSWPASPRKQDRKKCLEKWRRHGWDAEADAIVAHVEACKASRAWREGYEPAPMTYLNGERWRDGAPVEAARSVFEGAE
jgi:hypothetical protein